MTVNRPAKQKPVTKRIADHITGSMTRTSSSVPADAIAASAEKERTWPTAFMMRRDEQAAEQEAAEIGGAHEADGRRRKAFLRAAQRDQRALQAVAAEQDACGDEEGDQRTDGGHEWRCRTTPLAASSLLAAIVRG